MVWDHESIVLEQKEDLNYFRNEGKINSQKDCKFNNQNKTELLNSAHYLRPEMSALYL